ncbi:MAG: MBL fold metallo-hydrolase [Prolixibacteraceae bacterium]|jgi:hydroxyacylglutathione hydrolase|nr:MBL fold metallo-hydrolase [Prolixibacteraceae bacterium]
MNNWKTKNGYEITQVLSGRSNTYLVLKDRLVILIDTGKESAFRKLSKNIDSLGLSLDKITHLILTHTHFDHCQLAKKIKDNSLCEIFVSCIAEDSIKNGYTELPKGTTYITRIISGLGRLIGKNKFGYAPFKPDVFIHEDHVLKIADNRIKIIKTSGHSDDSISILIDDEIAIVGDVMFGVLKNSIFPPYADSTNDLIKSWGKLLNTTCNVFLPGHGKEIKIELLKKEYDKYARKHNTKYPLGNSKRDILQH